ncbi:MAG: NADH-quinone oxidoreductase subunit H [Candidatus Margulisiibacteriota bacterium]|jgi:formate hydrogenlyase subunit 4
MINAIFYIALNLLLVIILAPFYVSLTKKIKAWTQLRKGPNLFQTYYNLFKLLKKETIYAKNSSWIMRLTPSVSLALILIASLFVPLIFVPNKFLGLGNIILFLYLLALRKFLIALCGLDAGSTFGGMGSSREMSISSVIEPVSIIIFAALAYVFSSMNFFDIFHKASLFSLTSFNPSLLLLGIPFFIVLITESARIPIDNPETHLELTMIHEAMILEQSGKNLALLELSSAIMQLLFIAVFINIFLPSTISVQLSFLGIIIAFVLFLFKSILLAVFIGLFESYFAKLRFFRIPNLVLIAFFLSLLTIFLEVLR